jgi:hypothetical protein
MLLIGLTYTRKNGEKIMIGNHRVDKTCSAVYVDCEMPADMLQSRMKALTRGLVRKDGAHMKVSYQKARGFYGEDTDPYEIRFIPGIRRIYWCVVETDYERRYKRAVKLLNRRMSQTKIAKLLQCNQSTISVYKKKAIQDGLLDKTS